MSKSTLEIYNYLSEFVTEARCEVIEGNANNRTNYITIALENVYQPQNASAVLRTCDCLGIQNVHIIENSNEYEIIPRVTLGSNKWLNIHRYNQSENNSTRAIEKLKSEGYRIVATTPHTNDVLLEDFNVEKGKFALVFGTERHGISPEVMNLADEYLRIPMYGFTESYNLSVSAAIIAYTLMEKLRKSNIDWKISQRELDELKLAWMRESVKSCELVESLFLNKNK